MAQQHKTSFSVDGSKKPEKAEPKGSAHLHLVILLLMSCSSAELMSSLDNIQR
jgi:hypothetical protein